MGRYKENYAKIRYACILIFLLCLPFQAMASEVITLEGYINKYDIPKFKKITETKPKSLYLFVNSSGGKLESIFDIAKEIHKIKSNKTKVYSIIHEENVAYAGAFFLVLFSDIIFYDNPLNLGVFTPISLRSYQKYQPVFASLFKESAEDEGKVNAVIDLFLTGAIFNPHQLQYFKSKFIQIEVLEDIGYSIPEYKVSGFKKQLDLSSYIFTPDFIFILFNFTLILGFISVYFTKNILLSILSIFLILFFVFLSFEITINIKAVFALIFSHFMLIFNRQIRFKYLNLIASISTFILSSIFFIYSNNLKYYMDDGFRVSIVTIVLGIMGTIVIYKVLLSFFYRRFKKFNHMKNEIQHQEACVTSVYPLSVELLGDSFPAISINKLSLHDRVRVVGFKGLNVIVESIKTS